MAAIVVLGAGFGGITVATRLAGALQGVHSITLVDKADSFAMGLAKLWMLIGERGPGEGVRSLSLLENKAIRVLQAEVLAIDPKTREVATSQGTLACDILVIALGAETAPEAIPGLSPAANLYDRARIPGLRDRLQALDKGEIAIAICSSPYKCPPAPFECALLVEDWLRKTGRREKVGITVYVPEARPLMVAGPPAGKRVKEFVEGRGVKVALEHKLLRVEEEGRRLVFENGIQAEADLLLAIPPHKAPAVVLASGLAEPPGWIPVDPRTLATAWPGVYAVGDVAGLKLPAGGMLPKAGIFAELEGQLVAESILASLDMPSAPGDFDGQGYCFFEVGGGQAMKMKGSFFNDPETRIAMEPPSEEGFQAKRQFEIERLEKWFGR